MIHLELIVKYANRALLNIRLETVVIEAIMTDDLEAVGIYKLKMIQLGLSRVGSKRVAKILSESNTFHINSKAIQMLSCKYFATFLDPPLLYFEYIIQQTRKSWHLCQTTTS